jgi:hypothetical protein
MLMFNGDVEIISENSEWVVYGVKAMDYFYAVKIPIHLKEKAESSKQKLDDSLLSYGLSFIDLVIDIREEKGRNYNAEIEEKAYEQKPRKGKEGYGEQQSELF